MTRLLAILLALSAPAAATAAVLHVPGDFPQIQQALNAAQPGDTVRVAAGIFAGPGNRGLDTRGKALSLLGAGPGATVLDCEGAARGFLLQGDADTRCLVRGFTVLRGAAEKGAGALCEGTSPRLESCQFLDCRADYGGGLASTWEAAPRLRACVFVGNRARLGGDDLYLVGGELLLRDCRATGVLALAGARVRRLDGGGAQSKAGPRERAPR